MSGLNVIKIAAWSRPELLKLHLARLWASGELEKFKVRVHTETGHHPDIITVCEWFRKEFPHVDFSWRVLDDPPGHIKGYYNILMGYKEAAEETDEYVLANEEDILPTWDYLQFCDAVYHKFLKPYPEIFCLAHKRRQETENIGHTHLLVGDHQCTMPMCISKKVIEEHMLPRFEDPMYFTDPIGYNAREYPDSRMRPNYLAHNDGQIERMVEKAGMWALKPDAARTMHVGLDGINCSGFSPTGTLEEKAKWYVDAIGKGGNYLREHTNNPYDICVAPHPSDWEEEALALDIDRNRCIGTEWKPEWCFDPNNEFRDYIRWQEEIHDT